MRTFSARFCCPSHVMVKEGNVSRISTIVIHENGLSMPLDRKEDPLTLGPAALQGFRALYQEVRPRMTFSVPLPDGIERTFLYVKDEEPIIVYLDAPKIGTFRLFSPSLDDIAIKLLRVSIGWEVQIRAGTHVVQGHAVCLSPFDTTPTTLHRLLKRYSLPHRIEIGSFTAPLHTYLPDHIKVLEGHMQPPALFGLPEEVTLYREKLAKHFTNLAKELRRKI